MLWRESCWESRQEKRTVAHLVCLLQDPPWRATAPATHRYPFPAPGDPRPACAVGRPAGCLNSFPTLILVAPKPRDPKEVNAMKESPFETVLQGSCLFVSPDVATSDLLSQRWGHPYFPKAVSFLVRHDAARCVNWWDEKQTSHSEVDWDKKNIECVCTP